MDKLEHLKEKISKTIANSSNEEDSAHSLNTLDWVLTLKPDASMALQIAALAHDIDRSVQPRIFQKENETYDEYKQRHANRSAEIISNMMKELDFEEETIQKVHHLVTHHEVGGDEESNILMNADSISYFDNSIAFYLKRKGEDYTKEKIRFMYERATDEAKQVIINLDLEEILKKLINDAINHR